MIKAFRIRGVKRPLLFISFFPGPRRPGGGGGGWQDSGPQERQLFVCLFFFSFKSIHLEKATYGSVDFGAGTLMFIVLKGMEGSPNERKTHFGGGSILLAPCGETFIVLGGLPMITLLAGVRLVSHSTRNSTYGHEFRLGTLWWTSFRWGFMSTNHFPEVPCLNSWPYQWSKSLTPSEHPNPH